VLKEKTRGNCLFKVLAQVFLKSRRIGNWSCNEKNSLITFKTDIQKEGAFTFVAIPFSPREVWGAKPRYNVTGTINGFAVRGCLGALKQNYFLRLSATWLRESGVSVGEEVGVKLEPEEKREK
jgi:hypothetical protein